MAWHGLVLWFASISTAFACVLQVGVVPQFEERKLLEVWQPVLEYVSNQSGCQLYWTGSANIPDFEDRFIEGAYDLSYMNPYHALLAWDAQKYRPLVRSGSRKLQGVLVVREGGSINRLDDLNGKTLAFPSPNALGASLLMRAELATLHGLDITPKYVKTHPSVYLHVAKGLVPAGGGVARTLAAADPLVKSRLKVLYETRAVAPHPLVIHPRIPEQVASKIQAAFLKLQVDHPELLAGIPMNDPVKASIDDYLPLRDLNLKEFQQ